MTNSFSTDEHRRQWDERYGGKGFVFGVEPNRFVAEALTDLPPGRALDLGSGQGRNAVWLATQGHEVTAVDLSPVATDQARRLAKEAGVSADFIAADLVEWEPQPGSFDLVLLSYTQVPPEVRRTIHDKAVRALAPGGVVFVIAHHLANLTDGIGGPQSPDVLFTEEDLAGDFAVLEVERLERVVRAVEGEGGSGEAIDVLMLARKAA